MGNGLSSSPEESEVGKVGKVGEIDPKTYPHHHLPSRREVGGVEVEKGSLGEVREKPSSDLAEIRFVHGQFYKAVEVVPYTRRDGTATSLQVWQSRCAECGTPFSFMAPISGLKFEPNRRCQTHKRPGLRPHQVVRLMTARSSDSRAEACRRWPAMAKRFAAKGSDGLAEAALIAVAGMAREAAGR